MRRVKIMWDWVRHEARALGYWALDHKGTTIAVLSALVMVAYIAVASVLNKPAPVQKPKQQKAKVVKKAPPPKVKAKVKPVQKEWWQ